MHGKSPAPLMPKQANVLTLKEGMDRTNYWREAVKTHFEIPPSKVPVGFFIPFEDFKDIVEAYKGYVDPKGNERPCVGVRIYLTLPGPVAPGQPIPPDSLSGVLVPCYAAPVQPAGGEVGILPPVDYKDILIEVPADKQNAYSIYDLTQPCPPMCDPESPLM
ncbi:MAG: hypothetical protein J0H92_19455 [Sphingobacteriales bacterium]|nr:hypothetical protein [Sphingobacteriales bacterium]NCT76124.1 hypothetical protein [Chitinophagaceae bacterium]OJW34000.1 MAG: hypothetical protein BGO54_04800 [Sphingobacteriales bacterium 46-32]